MKTAKDFIRDLWCDLANKPEESPLNKKDPPKKKYDAPIPPLEELKLTQWDLQFEELSRARLIMGVFRYGLIEDQDFSNYDLPRECKSRLNKYLKTKNLEHLVDASNMCHLQFIHGKRLGQKLIPIDDGEHTPEINNLNPKIKKDFLPNFDSMTSADFLEAFLLFRGFIFAIDTRQKYLGVQYLDHKIKQLKDFFNKHNIPFS